MEKLGTSGITSHGLRRTFIAVRAQAKTHFAREFLINSFS